MKAVILSGSPGTALFPLSNLCPKLMLPLANEPFIKYLINSLQKRGITEVAILSSAHQDCGTSLISRLNSINGRLRIVHFEEKELRGTAGSLKMLDGFTGSSDFLVISSNIFIEKLDVPEIMDLHQAHGAGVTMVVEQLNEKLEELENVEIGRNGVVSRIHMLHRSKNNRQHLTSSGIYVFSPSIYQQIYEKGYMDIKEQLIPRLHSEGITVLAYKLHKPVEKINSHTDYMKLNKKILFDDMQGNNGIFNSRTEIMNSVWVGKNVEISPRAYLLGPVVIGDNCVIEDYSQIIGPTSVGNESRIGKDVLVRESILWEKTHLKKGTCIEYSLISDSSVISEGEKVKDTVVINEKKYPGYLNMSSLTNELENNAIHSNGSVLSPFLYAPVRYKIFSSVKRSMDILFSAFFLILSLPIFIIIPLAIKIDSPGPVFFRQKRCGKEGAEFRMFKFRTMVHDAEKIHDQLIERNDLDGPMFKMMDDPRITRFGKFLRRTSLDEIPQFINVLKGEMSLIGPRPLVMEEMKFSPNWRDMRLKVKPGITGLWQTRDKSDLSFQTWIKSDIDYVKKQSIRLDFIVLAKTICQVVRGFGAKH